MSPYNNPESVSHVTTKEGQYQSEMARRMLVAQERMARLAFNHTHPVDEYISSAGVPATDANYPPYTSYVQLQPTWEIPERIDSLIATIPAGATAAVAKLGDRWIDLLSLASPSQEITGSNQQSFAGVSPGAGNSYNFQNTTGLPFTLLAAQFFLQTSATVLNRFPEVIVLDASGNIIFSTIDVTAVVASSSITTHAYIGATQLNSSSGNTILPLAQGVVVPPGGTVRLTSANLDAGDTISAITMTIDPSGDSAESPATVVMDGLGIILSRDDDRLLLLQGTLNNGPTHFELMGYADEIWGNA
jgi:hypothetical protein